LINDDNGKCVGVFLPLEVQKYYKLNESGEKLNTDFVVSFYASHDTSKILALWWREDNKSMNQTSGWYPMVNLREPYAYLMALLYRLHGEKDYSQFSEALMPLAFTVVISGTGFNWSAIISKKSSTYIKQAQVPKEGDTLSFYMASYLLDINSARNAFVGMKLNWHPSEPEVHVHYSILWENRYKKSYVVISSFGATRVPHLLPLYVPDRLVLGEICYQTIIQGYNATLVKDKKWDFIPYGFHISFCMVKDIAHDK
jgi:hypothetical protein